MKSFFIVVVSFFCSLTAMSQLTLSDISVATQVSSRPPLMYVDSTEKELSLKEVQSLLSFTTGRTTIYFDPLYDAAFTEICDDMRRDMTVNTFISSNSEINSTDPEPESSTENEMSQITYSASCLVKEIEIIDSIDLNHDGVKELFFRNEMRCFVSPSDLGWCGVGGQKQTYSKYEVWDVKANKQLFQYQNVRSSQVAVTVNVQYKYGEEKQLKIEKDGCIVVSTYGGKTETYKFNSLKGGYKIQ